MSFNWETEVFLAPETAAEVPYQRISAPQRVLLTGATGFLGAYLLLDLLDLTQAEVYCLVRSDNPTHGQERLLANLARYQLSLNGHESRVFVIAGDMEQPDFGLDAVTFEWLCTQIDTIYHAAASVSFMPGFEQLKAINIVGLQQVLRLAGRRRTKMVHYVSTYAVFNTDHYKGHKVCYERELEGPCSGMARGYDKTKWVAEKICHLAQARGIPVNIYRAGFITGDTENGILNAMDPVALMFAVTLCSGYALTTKALLHLTPVDFCSRALTKISLNPAAENRIFHLVQETELACQDYLDWLEEEGYQLERVDFNAWYEHLKQLCIRFPVFYPVLGLLSMAENRSFGENDNIATMHFDTAQTRGFLPALDHCPPMYPALLRKYFAHITAESQPYQVLPPTRRLG